MNYSIGNCCHRQQIFSLQGSPRLLRTGSRATLSRTRWPAPTDELMRVTAGNAAVGGNAKLEQLSTPRDQSQYCDNSQKHCGRRTFSSGISDEQTVALLCIQPRCVRQYRFASTTELHGASSESRPTRPILLTKIGVVLYPTHAPVRRIRSKSVVTNRRQPLYRLGVRI